mmetsp:Transcript_12221/g.22588  ORF Transcript_12221/g.22588 Transcript_12221/m.22588 type:complete len:457 (-) Transcript_12221:127-1497(-)
MTSTRCLVTTAFWLLVPFPLLTVLVVLATYGAIALRSARKAGVATILPLEASHPFSENSITYNRPDHAQMQENVALIAHASYGDPKGPCNLDLLWQEVPPGSPAMEHYLAGVYGNIPRVIVNTWNWTAVDVVWREFLPEHVQKACAEVAWRPVRGTIFHTGYDFDLQMMRIYQHSGGACSWRTNDGRLVSNALPIVEGVWLEVQHAHLPLGMEDTGFWAYRAVGSGIWYYTGRTLIVEDVIDLSRMLGIGLRDSCDAPETASRMPHLLCDSIPHGRYTTIRGKPLVLQWTRVAAREHGIDTVVFTHHVDGGWRGDQPLHSSLDCPWTQRVKPFWSELIGFRALTPRRCPQIPGHLIQTGWADRLHSCKCLPGGSLFLACVRGPPFIDEKRPGKWVRHMDAVHEQLDHKVIGYATVQTKHIPQCPLKLAELCNMSLATVDEPIRAVPVIQEPIGGGH